MTLRQKIEKIVENIWFETKTDSQGIQTPSLSDFVDQLEELFLNEFKSLFSQTLDEIMPEEMCIMDFDQIKNNRKKLGI